MRPRGQVLLVNFTLVRPPLHTYQPTPYTIDADRHTARVYTRDATSAALLTFPLTLWRMKFELMALHLSFTPGTGIIKYFSYRL